MSMIRTLANTFQTGRTLTSKDIQRMGIANPRAAVNTLRNQGYCIYTNKNGYRLGTPTKRMVALASRILGREAFSGV